MPTVLVGVDASERSFDAIAFTRQVALASGSSVLVATAFPYEDIPSRASSLAYRQALESDAVQTVRRMSAWLDDLGDGRVRTTVIARISPAHGLHDLAEKEHADLIVVGSSHVGAAGRVMPGSTGERLLHGATCPVAVAPEGHRTAAHALRGVGVAYDGSREAEAALRAGTEVARATGAELRVIAVIDALGFTVPAMLAGTAYALDREATEKEVRAQLDGAVGRLTDVSAEGVLVTGDPARELAAQTDTLDLLIAGSRGYGPLRAVLLGGVTGRLLRDAACPVVVIPRGVESPLGELFSRSAKASA